MTGLAEEGTLVPGLYRLPDDPVGPKVLIPGFRSSTSVRGAFGWFSAGWIGRLAPGLAEYLSRDDTTPIAFTVAPTLFEAERVVVEQAYSLTPDEAAERVAAVFVEGRANADAMALHALDCLAWMLATGRLRLRVAVPTPTSNYHPKIWLFDDGEHQVLARGSGNATGRGVGEGVEHLDVDVSWIGHSATRVRDGVAILDDWSRGISAGIERVVDLPDALEQRIIGTAPGRPPVPEDFDRAVTAGLDPADALKARFGRRKRPDRPRLKIPSWLEWQTGDYAHQGEAVEAWEGGEDPGRGTLAMATGAGKTLAALICGSRLQDRSGDPLAIVVSAPSVPLVEQWIAEVEKFGVEAISPHQAGSTDEALTGYFRGVAAGGTHVLVITNRLLCTGRFQETFAAKTSSHESLLIADEAHSLGSEGFVSNKPEFFNYRLALSATPERQYDPDGTEEIFEFFGPPCYEFGLDRAIGFCLTPYNYYVHAATLDDDELDEFERLTARIGAAIGRNEDDETLTALVIARRRIIEAAVAKLSLLRAVLERRGPRDLDHALIYASAKNPEQFDAIGVMLTDLGVRWAPVTQETTANRRLLKETLETFSTGGYQVLLAKKVLDEGVDIPSTREAFIVASSTVQREWVQRRGRVLRQHPGKPWAIVHDFLALPPTSLVHGVSSDSNLKRIVRSELDRAYSFAAHARNVAGQKGVLEDLQRIRAAYWPDREPIRLLSDAGDQLLASNIPEGAPW